jgi:lauroyl/myristoyl acyltransferase
MVGIKNDRIKKDIIHGIIKHYYEKLMMAYYSFEKLKRMVKKSINIKGKKLIDEGLKNGKGVVLVTAHFGAVEYLPLILVLNKYKINFTVKFKTQQLKETLEKHAKKYNANLIDCSQNQNIFFKACKYLQKNELFVTECDEVSAWTKDSNRTIKLFNEKIYLDRGIDILARRTGAKVLSIFVRRLKNNKFSVEIKDVLKVKIKDEKHSESIVYKNLKIFQDYIKRYPDQYYEWKNIQAMKVSP